MKIAATTSSKSEAADAGRLKLVPVQRSSFKIRASWRRLLRNGCYACGFVLSILLARGASAAPEPGAVEHLGDHPELIVSSVQAWGELGFNTAAHAPGVAGAPLQIGGQSYTKGLGHHAAGSIEVLLDGEYAAFDADVGVQTCEGGSVIFRIYRDDKLAFESGVLRSGQAAQPVHVDLAGAQDLRLETADAGDGIGCDMANWANGRLTRAAVVTRAKPQVQLDVAPFARVVTWDPNRTDGCRASRIQEFRAEDLFLDTDLKPDSHGAYLVPTTNGLGCIGLQWLNRRALKQVELEFAQSSQMPLSGSVRIEGWFGESAWQGAWKALTGKFETEGNKLIFRVQAGSLQTQKVRWIFPVEGRCVVAGLSAYTRSRWNSVGMVVETEGRKGRGALKIYNGELLRSVAAPEDGRTPQTEWELSHPLHLNVRYSRPSSFKSDPTVLEFRLPTGAFGVAVEDVLTNQCVYVSAHGLFVARESAGLSLAQYKQQIAGGKTILEQVREMPDQTFERAMTKTRHPIQDNGPVLLSLACDNVKFVVAREGSVQFATSELPPNPFRATLGEMRPRFGAGSNQTLHRKLEGDWLPIPVITVEKNGIVYTQRTFVAPCDEPGSQPTRLNRQSICVAEFIARNSGTEPAEAALTLSFLQNVKDKKSAQVETDSRGYRILKSSGLMARVDTSGAGPLRTSNTDDAVALEGTLPPQSTARCVVYFPGVNLKPDDLNSLSEPSILAKNLGNYWKAMLAPAMQVEVPEPLLENVIHSSQVRCLINARSEENGARVAPWIAAMAYGPLESESHSIIRGMDLMGHRDFAQRGLDYFVRRYNQEGFLTTGYTVFGTGWHLWTLGEHYQLNRDTEWFQKVAPEVARVDEWIVSQLQKTKHFDAFGHPRPEFGLMPPGVLADWNAFAYHFCMSAYYYAALLETGTALKQIHYPGSATFLKKADELRANLLRAYRWTQSQTPVLPLRNGSWVPAYVSQVHSPGKLGDFFPGQDAGRSWCYDVELGAHQLVPTRVFDAQTPEVTRMMDHMEDVQFLSEGWFDYPAEINHKDWFNLGGFSKVQPYYTRNAEIYALRDEVKPFVRSYFNTLAAMLNTEVLTLWEHFHDSGAWDKTHETGYFLQQTRFMVLMEHGDELWLAPLVTANWFKPGMTVAAENAPTRFGKVSYRIQSHTDQGYVEATVNPPERSSPKKLVLRVRHPEGKPIRSVTVNGKSTRSFDPTSSTVSFVAHGTSPIRLRIEF